RLSPAPTLFRSPPPVTAAPRGDEGPTADRRGGPRVAGGRWSADDGVDDGLRPEGGQVVRTLTEADELDRHAQGALHRDDDATLGGPVELGEHHTGDVDRLGEDLRLRQAVLPRRGIEDEEHLVDRALLLD